LEIVDQSETLIVSSSDVQFYPEGRLGLSGASAQEANLDRYSYDGANSHKSYVDQEDRG